MRNKIVTIGETERDSMVLINTKITCAEQALRVMPEGLTDTESVNYIKGCIDSLSDYKWLEKDWWYKIRKAYNLTEEEYPMLHLDFDSAEIYNTKG